MVAGMKLNINPNSNSPCSCPCPSFFRYNLLVPFRPNPSSQLKQTDHASP